MAGQTKDGKYDMTEYVEEDGEVFAICACPKVLLFVCLVGRV